MTAKRTSRRAVALLAGAWLLAIALRTLPFAHLVLRHGEIFLYDDTDPFYHLRRIRLATEHWPIVPEFDAWLDYPKGAFTIWPPLFDLLPATVARALGIDPDLVAIAWPAVLGGFTCLALYALVARLCDARAGMLALLPSLALPQLVLLSALGRVDHHIAELLCELGAFALYATLITCAEQVAARPADGAQGRFALGATAQPAWALGLVMGASLLTWTGSLVYLCVLPAVGCIAALRADARARLLTRAQALSFACAAAAVLPHALLNLSRGRPAFASTHLSMLHVALCLLFGGVPVATCWIVSTARRGWGAARMPALYVLALLSLPLLHPALRHGIWDGLTFLSRRQSPWLSTVTEVKSVITSAEAHRHMLDLIGYGLYGLPAAACVLLWTLLRKRGEPLMLWLALCWLVHSLLLALAQLRFVAYAAPALAAAPALVLHVANALEPKAQGRRALQALALLLALAPAPAYRFWPQLLLGERDPQIRVQTLRFLQAVRAATPSAGDVRDTTRAPAYAIMAPWDLGHALVTVSERAVVATPFGTHIGGSGFADAERVYDTIDSERELDQLLDRRGCRYLITAIPAAGAPASAARTFVRRLHDRDGSDLGDQLGSGRFALRVELQSRELESGALYKLFERVPGALLRVHHAPEGVLHASLLRRMGTRSFVYDREAARVAERGEAEVRLAYAGSYQLTLAGRALGEIHVPPRSVSRGERVELDVSALAGNGRGSP